MANTKTILDKNKPLIFFGDHHGSWNELFYLIDSKQIKNSYIFSVGDLGIGFKYKKEYEYSLAEKLNIVFAENNNIFLGIRGNHDNSFFFTGENRINLSHFQLLEDYSLLEYNNKTIQAIGGAISVDRVGRKEGVSYWSDEGVVFKKSKCKKVDILVTHTAPTHCFPQQFNHIVYGWAKEDSKLLKDLTEERKTMDKIFELCNPNFHFYGHFHSSWMETIGNCRHKLLNINELADLF